MELEKKADAAVRACWLGNNGWLLKNGKRSVSTDLILDDPIRVRPAPLLPDGDLSRLTLHFVTHEHADHFHAPTCLRLAVESDCLFVVPKSCAHKAIQIGLPENRIILVEPGQGYCLRGIRFYTVRAVHGHIGGSIYKGASLQDCGYIIELGELRIFQPGDTVLLQEHQEEIRNIDVMFVSPTEHNMWVKQSAEAIACIEPKRIFAQHFGTFRVTSENRFWTIGYEQELAEALPPKQRARYTIPVQGVWYPLYALTDRQVAHQ